MKRSGQQSSVGQTLCPFYEEMDRFLGSRPLTQPHYQQSSSEDITEFEPDVDSALDTSEMDEPDGECNDNETEEEAEGGVEHVNSDSETTREFTAPRGRVSIPGTDKRKKRKQGVTADV